MRSHVRWWPFRSLKTHASVGSFDGPKAADSSHPSELSGAVYDWNILQAVLRKASRVIEACFFALQTRESYQLTRTKMETP